MSEEIETEEDDVPRATTAFRMITRRQNDYMIPTQSAMSHADYVAYETGHKLRSDLYTSCFKLAGRANSRALRYKGVALVVALFILVASFVGGILALGSQEHAAIAYTAGVLGLLVGFCKAFAMTFSLESIGRKLGNSH